MTTREPGRRRTGAGVINWVFRDRRTGRITIAQRPNLTLSVFLVTVAARFVVSDGTAARATIDWIGSGALAAWAIDEIVRGVNPWRRALGAAACVAVGVGIVTRLR